MYINTYTYDYILYIQEMGRVGEGRVVEEFFFQILFLGSKVHSV
jgi:hypothetical protein